MELNRINYKKAMDKISIPKDADDKVIKKTIKYLENQERFY